MDSESIPLRSLSHTSIDDHSIHEDSFTPFDEQEASLPKPPHVQSTLYDRDHRPDPPASASPTATLHRSFYVLFLVSLYAILALFAWTVTCIMSYRPLTTATYSINVTGTYSQLSGNKMHALYVRNEEYFRAARVIQSIVGVLTIPVTSAVCAKAAVIFAQRNKYNLRLTLRQTMVLADKGWTDPSTIISLLFAGGKRLGSSFLILAILLHLLGAIISPLQQLFLTQQTIRTPTGDEPLQNICDILDHFQHAANEPLLDDNLVTVLTRQAMASASNGEPQSRLWQGNPTSCNALNATYSSYGSYCWDGAATLANISTLGDPFLSQLPTGYSTGLMRQFVPRINSTAVSYTEGLDTAQYPQDCGSEESHFFVNYSNMTANDLVTWSIEACMPENELQTPWASTRLRQDFTEVLYLNISVNWQGPDEEGSTTPSGNLIKLMMNTTAGFFELPNYMNGQVPGPLIDGEPDDHCLSDCKAEGYGSNAVKPAKPDMSRTVKRQTVANSSLPLLALESVPNKGPLLTIAMALFGEGSWLANRVDHPQAYISPAWNINIRPPAPQFHCVEMTPFAPLLQNQAPQFNPLGECSKNNILSIDDLQSSIAWYLQLFYDSTTSNSVQNAFTAAAFLANEAWLVNPPADTLGCNMIVYYDLGADTLKPEIRPSGIVVVSTTLGLYLLCLFTMAFYSALTPRWTAQLDSFAMMRIGASIAKDLPLRLVDDVRTVRSLDTVAGWLGDAGGGEDSVSEIGLGAAMPLSRRRRYRSYG